MRLGLFAAVICLSVIYAQCGPIQKEEPEPAPHPQTAQQAQVAQKETPSNEVQVSPEPVQTPKEGEKGIEVVPVDEKAKATGRQSSDDDDDDDDDDDLDLGVDDDDDDDDDDSPSSDDDDDDDDDDDYFERFFDDILGEDDDDDDDDEPSPSTGLNQPADPVPDTPVDPDDEQPLEENNGEVDASVDEQGDTNLSEKDPTETAASSQNAVVQPVVVQPVPADDDDDDDADDDDDDDDDVESDLDDLDDDDDDDDGADDDDDDDDDDEADDLEDVIEAKRSRSLQSSTRIPAIYISKYNRFVDNILGRINRILGKSYDPVRVKLQSAEGNTKKKNSSTKKRKSGSKKKSGSRIAIPPGANKMGDMEIARNMESESREPAFILISQTSALRSSVPIKNITLEVRASPSNKKNRNKSNKNKNGNGATSNGNKNRKGTTKKGGTKQNSKQATKARATLFGLSTLRREGDVVVNSMADFTNVKTNFVLGPLTLRVEKEFGRGSKRQLKSATATTAEMYGKLNLKIVHGGAATLHSIKVLQPKQVRVDSADNHEKTKQYMWRRSSHIASVVSRKLASAARSMLKPPPQS